MEREWRESVDMRPSALMICLAMLVGAVLRFWRIGQGIPTGVGPGEDLIIGTVVGMMKSGDFNPHVFGDPALYIYVQLVVACAQFLTGVVRGAWQSLADVGPAQFFLWGRAATALAGVATIAAVYQIGLRWGSRHALLAAGLIAVIPGQVQASHAVATPVPLTLLIALTFLFAVRAIEKRTVASFAWAGGLAGLAAAVDYSGALVLLVPLLAVALSSGECSKQKCIWSVLGAAAVFFLVAAPYTVWDLPGFLNGVAAGGGLSAPRNPSAGPAWLALVSAVRQQLGWPGFALMAAGAVLTTRRALKGAGHARATLLLAVPILALVSAELVGVERVLQPMLPAALLMVAIATISGVSQLRRFDFPRWLRTTIIVLLAAASLLPPLVASIAFVRSF
jgi:4-amino-4-deoxy-L-arabinose transferase-like glycosyltransferase